MKIHPYYFSRGKRMLDVVLAFILLVLLSPVFVVIGFCVLVTAGQPILFRQKRAGKNGAPFLFYKFRTMEKNAAMLKHKYLHLNVAPAPMFKIHNDPRFVGMGWFLSHSGLDELPQLWNILKGEMSFVGPRPLPVPEARALPANWREWRERVAPGVFSQWALSGERHESLIHWQQFEKNTLRFGSPATDLKYVVITPLSQIALLIQRTIKPAKSA